MEVEEVEEEGVVVVDSAEVDEVEVADSTEEEEEVSTEVVVEGSEEEEEGEDSEEVVVVETLDVALFFSHFVTLIIDLHFLQILY